MRHFLGAVNELPNSRSLPTCCQRIPGCGLAVESDGETVEGRVACRRLHWAGAGNRHAAGAGRRPVGHGAEGQVVDAPTREQLLRIYAETKTIAVVGASGDPSKPAHRIPRYLQSQGYRIRPVNPRGGEILGEAVARSL